MKSSGPVHRIKSGVKRKLRTNKKCAVTESYITTQNILLLMSSLGCWCRSKSCLYCVQFEQWGSKHLSLFTFKIPVIFSLRRSGVLVLFSLSERWPQIPPPLPSPLFHADFLSPINVLLFYSAAVTESPALFPVVKAHCLATGEGGAFAAEGGLFSAGVKLRQRHVTASQLLVGAAQARTHRCGMELV